MYCLIKPLADKLLKAIKSGEFDPVKMSEMKSSREARDYFAKFVGEADAEAVNTLYEQKLLLKNRELAEMNFYREILGDKEFTAQKEKLAEQARTRAEARKNRVYDPKADERTLDEITSDAYSKKYKTEVSLEESQTITDLSQDLAEAKKELNPDFTWKSEEGKFKAGASERALVNYTNALKSKGTLEPLYIPKLGEGTIPEKLINLTEGILDNARISFNFIAQTSRGAVAGIADNSFWGNQGIKVLWNPKTFKLWAKNFVQSLIDIKEVLLEGTKRGDEIMDGVYADYYTRQNRLNGRYDAVVGEGKKGIRVDIGTGEEEVMDVLTHLGEIPIASKIPLLKQVFEVGGRMAKAANVAYEAGAMRLRMDVADRMYKWMEKGGVDMTSNREVGSRNIIINSMTGRGDIGAFQKAGKEINWAVFSIKFAKSNFDFLTAHLFDRNVSASAKAVAAQNLLTTVALVGTTLGIAKAFDPDSTDLDSRSAKFGKIYGLDITGGMASWAVLASRIATQSTKSSTTGLVTKFGTGYGQMSGLDVAEQFLENKASPLFSVFVDLLRQETFEKESPTLFNQAGNLLIPMGVSNTTDIWTEKGTGLLIRILGTALNLAGFNANKFSTEVDWGDNTTKELSQFLATVGEQKFKTANDQFNQEYDTWLKSIKNNPDFTKLIPDAQAKVITDKKSEIRKDIFKQYHFKYNPKSTIEAFDSADTVLEKIVLYATAIKTDPITAFNRMFTGQTIKRLDNGTIIVERMPLSESSAVKSERGAGENIFLDHTIPLELGGSNAKSNLRLVSEKEWKSYTPYENKLGYALRNKQITKKYAQQLITRLKKKTITGKEIDIILGKSPSKL